MTREAPRPVHVVSEELGDLRAYLQGVPSPVRNSPSFAPYERRLAMLEAELHDVSAEKQRPAEGVDAPRATEL